MDDGIGALFGLGILLVIAYLIIVVFVYVLGAFALVGSIYGLIMAVVNFFRSLFDVISYRIALGNYRDKATMDEVEPLLNYATKLEGYEHSFEEIGRPSYLLGPCFGDIKLIITQAFSHNFDSKKLLKQF